MSTSKLASTTRLVVSLAIVLNLSTSSPDA
jgi:hypothetical protein